MSKLYLRKKYLRGTDSDRPDWWPLISNFLENVYLSRQGPTVGASSQESRRLTSKYKDQVNIKNPGEVVHSSFESRRRDPVKPGQGVRDQRDSGVERPSPTSSPYSSIDGQ